MRTTLALVALVAAIGCGDGVDYSSQRVPARLWLVTTYGAGRSTGTLWSSDDGGESWRAAFTSAQALLGVAFTPRDRGAAVGEGIALFTNDGGIRWNVGRAVESERLQDVALGGDGHGLAVGTTLHGPHDVDATPLVLETRDAGVHWTIADVPPTLTSGARRFAATCLTASGTAFVIGDRVLRRDADGWMDLSGLVPPRPSTVACRDHDVWIGGSSLAHSADDGRTWESATQPLNDPKFFVNSLAFGDAGHGWLIGSLPIVFDNGLVLPNDFVLRTTDGGNTWMNATPPNGIGGYWTDVATNRDGSWALAGGAPFFLGCSEPLIAADGSGTRLLKPPGDCEDIRAVAIVP